MLHFLQALVEDLWSNRMASRIPSMYNLPREALWIQPPIQRSLGEAFSPSVRASSLYQAFKVWKSRTASNQIAWWSPISNIPRSGRKFPCKGNWCETFNLRSRPRTTNRISTLPRPRVPTGMCRRQRLSQSALEKSSSSTWLRSGMMRKIQFW